MSMFVRDVFLRRSEVAIWGYYCWPAAGAGAAGAGVGAAAAVTAAASAAAAAFASAAASLRSRSRSRASAGFLICSHTVLLFSSTSASHLCLSSCCAVALCMRRIKENQSTKKRITRMVFECCVLSEHQYVYMYVRACVCV